MIKRNVKIKAALIALIALSVCFSGCMRFGCASDPDRYLLFDTLTLVDDYYVYADKTEKKSMIREGFEGMALELVVREMEKERELKEKMKKEASENSEKEASLKPDNEPPDMEPAKKEKGDPGEINSDIDKDELEKQVDEFPDPEELIKKAPFKIIPGPQAISLGVKDKQVDLNYPENKKEMINEFFRGYDFLKTELGIPLSDKDFFYSGIDGMVHGLDPHSSFLTPRVCGQLREETTGSFAGVGIEIAIRNKQLTVIQPLEGTPAFRANIKARDIISAIEGKPTLGMGLMEAVEKIRGIVNTKVTLTIMRKGAKEPFDVELVRGKIDEGSIKAKLLPGGIVHIRLYKFNEKTSIDLEKAFNEMSAQAGHFPIKGMILDLRYNPGGLLDQAVEVSDRFIDSGLIVNTMGRGMFVDKRRFATSRETERDLPLIVLINLQSASGAEIVAGALQDHKRALLLGMRSYGKGSVQSIFKLPQDACLRLTTALYYTPSGRSIQATGVVPDISFSYPEEEEELLAEYTERAQPNHLENTKPDPNAKAGFTFEVEQIFAHYKNIAEITVDPDYPEKADWLLVFASKIMAGKDLSVDGMFKKGVGLLKNIPPAPPKEDSPNGDLSQAVNE